MKKQIIRLTEDDLHKIVENTINRILKENDYGLLTTNNTGKLGLRNAKIFNDIRQKLNNGESVSYQFPLTMDKVLSANITPLHDNVFNVETNYTSKQVVGVDYVIKYISDLYTSLKNKN